MEPFILRVHDIIENTSVNGPGNRICIWLQGCDRDCPGCFNQPARSKTGGTDMSVDDLMRRITAGEYDGVSLSGGEPFLQPQPVRALLRRVRLEGMDTLVFTGYTFEQLKADPVLSAPLEYVDYLVDGPYMRDIESFCSLTGSGNQRVLRLADSKIAEDLTQSFSDGCAASEVVIGDDGQITITGFDDILLK